MSLPTPAAETTAEANTGGPKWFGELVDTRFDSLKEITKVLPRFERRPFRLGSELRVGESSPGIKAKGENRFWDSIVCARVNG